MIQRASKRLALSGLAVAILGPLLFAGCAQDVKPDSQASPAAQTSPIPRDGTATTTEQVANYSLWGVPKSARSSRKGGVAVADAFTIGGFATMGECQRGLKKAQQADRKHHYSYQCKDNRPDSRKEHKRRKKG
jgi:hypothetical protein